MNSNLPPGCTVGEIERHFSADAPCDICHRWPEQADSTKECTCAECPKCWAFGDRACYEGGTCGGISGPVPTHDAATCEVCTPPKDECPKHGAYLLADGCEPCMVEALGYVP